MKLVSVLMVSFLLISCAEKKKEEKINDGGWDITIRGKVGFPKKDGTITIQEIRSDAPGKTDTIELADDYTFEALVHLKEPGNYYMNFYDKQILLVALNKSDIEVSVDGNSAQGFAEIKGSPEQDIVVRVRTMLGNKQSQLGAIEDDFNEAAQAGQQSVVESLRLKYMEANKKYDDSLANFLVSQPASIAVMDVLQQGVIDQEEYFNVYEEVSGKLSKEYPGADFAKPFIAEVAKMKSLQIGGVAPEIELPDPDGKLVKLSSLRGKYVLVDFWAKWCGPCRRENPNVVKAYKRFNKKGFEVYGVSLDRTRDEWVQAIEQDHLTWTHVSDLKYFDSQAAQDYNIHAIPFSILLDKNGVILAKNLRGAELEKKLGEVIN